MPDEGVGQSLLFNGVGKFITDCQHGIQERPSICFSQGGLGEVLELQNEKIIPSVPEVNYSRVVLSIGLWNWFTCRVLPRQLDFGKDIDPKSVRLQGRVIRPHAGKETLSHVLVIPVEHGEQAELHVVDRWREIYSDFIEILMDMIFDQVPEESNRLHRSAILVENSRVGGLKRELPLRVDPGTLPENNRSFPCEWC